MNETIPYKEIEEYIKENCPYNGLCFMADIDEKCPYELLDDTPCRYMPELIIKFKEVYERKSIKSE